jgi:hypothetical protein
METMKYYTFYRENNNFDDIESDNIIKKNVETSIKWYQHLMIGMKKENNDQNFSMLTLKYGEDMVNNLTKDFTPVAGVDYTPKKR